MTALPPDPPLWKRVLLLALPTLAQQGLLFVTQVYDQWLAKDYTAGKLDPKFSASGAKVAAE